MIISKIFPAPIFLALFLSGMAIAEEAKQKASPEALEACQAIDPSFNKIAECLPKMDVAILTLSAFSTIYPPTAHPVRTRCEDLNKDLIGAATCVEKAVESAVQLKDQLPDGADISDPLFASISDSRHMKQLNAVGDEARSKYPSSVSFMTMYQPYR